MKTQIALIATILLATACNGGAGGSPTATKSAEAPANTAPAAPAPVIAVDDSGTVIPNNAGTGTVSTMQSIVEAINNSSSSITITEDVGLHNAGDGFGLHELYTITLKCTAPMRYSATSLANEIFTANGDKYIAAGNKILCVPQKDAIFNLMTANLPEALQYARAGAIDYVVMPGTFSALKFHYAAINRGCSIQGPILDATILAPAVDTCHAEYLPLVLNAANFGNGVTYSGSSTFVNENYPDEIPASVISALGASSVISLKRSQTAVVNNSLGVAAGATIDRNQIANNTHLEYQGVEVTNFGYQADEIAIYNGVPRMITKIETSLWASGTCKFVANGCSADGLFIATH